ncbi:MAG: alpha/beta hydrolase [Chloroflexi bacterium]|nr:alpha/beta hydrolase [Chloroflexota bacterium]
MAVFVLIHGAWHGGWCWQRIAPRLRAAGHNVATPTLTGLGERAHLASPAIDLETHVTDVLAVLRYEDLHDVILVGHSYGGAVATLVTDRVPDRVARLVYLDAPIPRDGQCLLDVLTPAQAADFRARAARDGDGWRITPNAPAALGLDDPADAAWAGPRLTPQPLATFTQPVRLTSAGDVIPRAYVFCAPARPGSRLAEFAAQARAAGWAYQEVATGHDAMITAPAATAAALLALV